MALKFRRTLSMEDLVNASDEEMDDLLSSSLKDPASSQLQSSSSGKNGNNSLQGPNQLSSGAMKNGTRVGPMIAPAVDENDDFFLHGPQTPILNLNNTDTALDFENHQAASSSIPRSKSVRFEEHEGKDQFKNVRNQVNEVTDKMRDNVSRLLDREANLDSLSDLSDQLQYSSDIYRQSSEHLRRKMWWRQQRTRMVLGLVFVIGIVLLLIPIITKLLQ